MKKFIFTILLAAISTMTYSQVFTNETNDTITPLHEKYEKKFKELQLDDKSPFDDYKLRGGFSTYKTDLKASQPKVESYDINFPELKFYDHPPVLGAYDAKTSYTHINSTYGNFSFAFDYNYQANQKLADNLYLTSISSLETMPSVGSMRFVNPQLLYTPSEWLQISGGVYGSKYNLAGQAFNDIGYNGAMKIIPHDRVRINIFGQYSVYSRSNMIDMINYSVDNKAPINMGGPMMHTNPQRYYGGSIEFKVTEKFGIQAGIVRELNPFNGKWEDRRFVAPVFYGK